MLPAKHTNVAPSDNEYRGLSWLTPSHLGRTALRDDGLGGLREPLIPGFFRERLVAGCAHGSKCRPALSMRARSTVLLPSATPPLRLRLSLSLLVFTLESHELRACSSARGFRESPCVWHTV